MSGYASLTRPTRPAQHTRAFSHRKPCMNYLHIKYLHISCVGLSISLFILRGALQQAGVEWRRWRVLRVAPHVVDSVLLGSAIWLAMTIHQYPFVNSWLTAKLLALCVYVWLGKRAL